MTTPETPRTKAPIVLIVLLVAALIGCAVFAVMYFNTKGQIADTQAAIEALKADITAEQEKIEALDEDATEAEEALEDSAAELKEAQDAMQLVSDQLAAAQEAADFLTANVVMTDADGQIYHVYGCEALPLESITNLGNVELLDALGLKPCDKCH